MQINGMNTFLSRLTQNNIISGAQETSLAFMSPLQKTTPDTLLLSDIGKRLSFNTDKISTLERTQPSSDPILNLMDNAMSEVETILERMHALATTARDKGLTDLDRIDMQIEMEDLRLQLDGATKAMTEKLAKASGQRVQSKITVLDAAPGDGSSSVLQRARERIVRGEKWDVAEGFRQYGLLEEVRVGDRSIPVEVEEGELFVLPEDIDPETAVLGCLGQPAGGEWYVSDDNSLPTVREKLKASGTIVLMDSKLAAEGVERLEREMKDLKEIRQEFTAFQDSYMADLSKQLARTMGYAKIGQQLSSLTRINENSDENGTKKLTFNTPLGVMECLDGGNFTPKLVQPTTPVGSMFAKIDRLFDRISQNIANGMISEGDVETSFAWINAAKFTENTTVAA